MSKKYYNPVVEKQIRDYCRKKGICPTCKKREAAKGFVQCPECIEKRTNYNAMRRARDREAYNQSRREQKARLLAEGRCACGKPLAEGKKRCERCLLRNRQYRRENYVFKVKPEGICRWCNEPVVEGKKLCAAHYEKMFAVAAHARQYNRGGWKKSNAMFFGRAKDGRT